MEKQSLVEFLTKHGKPVADHARACASRPWYNAYGDCIEYQTEQVAVVADRIDAYLTIYRSAESDKPIGFQLKDVKELMKKFQANLYGVAWTTEEQKLVSVSALLLTAIEEGPVTIRKRRGYLDAFSKLNKDDEVPV